VRSKLDGSKLLCRRESVDPEEGEQQIIQMRLKTSRSSGRDPGAWLVCHLLGKGPWPDMMIMWLERSFSQLIVIPSRPNGVLAPGPRDDVFLGEGAISFPVKLELCTDAARSPGSCYPSG
jgi:hypothetical protein